MERILLHHCCAPCSPGAVKRLREEFSPESYWFNPNIHPEDEHARRRESLVRLTSLLGMPLHEGPALSAEAWREEALRAGENRCAYCYRIRMQRTAGQARDLGIGCFSTTLLASPYQKHELVRAAGEEAAGLTGTVFVYRDFRPSYYDGKNEAYRLGMYMQKYCGCSFSREERGAARRK